MSSLYTTAIVIFTRQKPSGFVSAPAVIFVGVVLRGAYLALLVVGRHPIGAICYASGTYYLLSVLKHWFDTSDCNEKANHLILIWTRMSPGWPSVTWRAFLNLMVAPAFTLAGISTSRRLPFLVSIFLVPLAASSAVIVSS